VIRLDAAEAAKSCREAGVTMIRFLFCDCSSIIRAKSVHVDALEAAARGVGLSRRMEAFNILDELAPGCGFEQGERLLVPDLDTLVVLQHAPAWAAVITNVSDGDGPAPTCPRAFLQRMLDRCETAGFRVLAAFENEFTLARQDGDRLVPLDTAVTKSTVGLHRAAPFVEDAVHALTAAGIGVEQYYGESAPGQQEITVTPVWGVRAADTQVLFREVIREVALRFGLVASFAPAPLVDSEEGNGCHIHFSLWNTSNTRNLFDSDDGDVSALGRKFVSGIVRHLPALLAVVCPTVNSYRRLRPALGYSGFTSWGVENREASIRLLRALPAPSLLASTSFELRVSDPSCNPYLALGALLAAGLDGLERGTDIPPTDRDPSDLDEAERERRGIYPYPSDLARATDALERDACLARALGDPLHELFVALKRSESDAFAQKPELEFSAHFDRF
jgi:glutamine synthetase